jgi:cell shape-determining protein MreD
MLTYSGGLHTLHFILIMYYSFINKLRVFSSLIWYDALQMPFTVASFRSVYIGVRLLLQDGIRDVY